MSQSYTHILEQAPPSPKPRTFGLGSVTSPGQALTELHEKQGMLGTCKEGSAEGKMDLSWTAMARSPFHLSLRVAGADSSTVYLTSELYRR